MRIKISNLGGEGELKKENKWYYHFELLKRPMCGDEIRPVLKIALFKLTKIGEPWKIDGEEQEMVGFRKYWRCPYGLVFRIEK